MPYRNKLQENPANEVGSPKIMLLIVGKPRFSMKRGENHNLFNGQALKPPVYNNIFANYAAKSSR
jgi:hypothetical protein